MPLFGKKATEKKIKDADKKTTDGKTVNVEDKYDLKDILGT